MARKLEVFPYSRKRYERLVKKGEQFRITFCGCEAKVEAVGTGKNHDNTIISYQQPVYGTMYTRSAVLNEKKDECALIWLGLGDIQVGDMICRSSSDKEGAFFFIGKLTTLHEKGYIIKWMMDCHGEQFDLCSLGIDIKGTLGRDPEYIRKATDEEIKFYYDSFPKNGYRYDEENGCAVPYPKIGEKYWSVEIEADGRAHVVAHAAPLFEEQRPIAFNVFTYKSAAEDVAERINEELKKRK